MSDRQAAMTAFVEKAGFADPHIEKLVDDASHRRYFRMTAPRQAVIMDIPVENAEENLPAFLAMTHHLRDLGQQAPEILAQDTAQGFVLLEDFGDTLLAHLLAEDSSDEVRFYQQAIDNLKQVQAAAPPADIVYEAGRSWSPPDYDIATLLEETERFTAWYLPLIGLEATRMEVAGWRTLWKDALKPVQAGPSCIALRDYHSENLMCLADGALGMIDYQDAAMSHPAFDLVSLLQDARRDVSRGLEREMLAYYCADMSTAEKDDFDAAYAVLGAQRNTRIIGTFARLYKRDGKPRYLDFIPRVWSYLERDLTHPALNRLSGWFHASVPKNLRRKELS